MHASQNNNETSDTLLWEENGLEVKQGVWSILTRYINCNQCVQTRPDSLLAASYYIYRFHSNKIEWSGPSFLPSYLILLNSSAAEKPCLGTETKRHLVWRCRFPKKIAIFASKGEENCTERQKQGTYLRLFLYHCSFISKSSFKHLNIPPTPGKIYKMKQQISSFTEDYFGVIYNGIRKGAKTADLNVHNFWWASDLSTFYFQGLQEHAAYQNILSKRRMKNQIYHNQL